MANNCTDDTLIIAQSVAERHQHEVRIDVLDMPHNPERKAGALNLGIAHLHATAPGSGQSLRIADAVRYMITIDADTVWDRYFVERAVRVLDFQLAERGYVFDPSSLVEDYALTLDLKDTSWKITTNQHCVAYTDIVPTLRALLGHSHRNGDPSWYGTAGGCLR